MIVKLRELNVFNVYGWYVPLQREGNLSRLDRLFQFGKGHVTKLQPHECVGVPSTASNLILSPAQQKEYYVDFKSENCQRRGKPADAAVVYGNPLNPTKCF